MPEAEEDLRTLDGSTRLIVRKAIKKVSQNPLPQEEGGYGKRLSNKFGTNLAGCLKIKLLRFGVRVVYKLERTDKGMTVIVIGARADNEVYHLAVHRLNRQSIVRLEMIP